MNFSINIEKNIIVYLKTRSIKENLYILKILNVSRLNFTYL